MLTGVTWDKWRHGRGTVQHPQASPETPLTLHSHEDPSRCSPRSRHRAGVPLRVVPPPQTTAPSPIISTSAQRTRRTWTTVNCLTQLWLWKDCPWEMEVGWSGCWPAGFWRSEQKLNSCGTNSSLTKNLPRVVVTFFFFFSELSIASHPLN